MSSKKKRGKDVKKQEETHTVSPKEVNPQEETHTVSPKEVKPQEANTKGNAQPAENLHPKKGVIWRLRKNFLSFFHRRKKSNLPQYAHEEKASSAERNPEGGKVNALIKWFWPRRERDPSALPVSYSESYRSHTLEEILANGTTTKEGFGSYYMPCCPCSGNLSDQPCMPKWCITYRYLDWLTVVALIFFFCWGTLYCINPTTVIPKGALFTLALASIVAYAAGSISYYFMKFPPMFFMFAVGFVFTNSPLWGDSAHFMQFEVEAVTAFILTIMVTKAALYFDMKIFMKHPLTILLLGAVPCIGEISTVGGVLYAICDFGLVTSFSVATVLANVSPVVMSHSLVTLAADGYGARTGILSILMAAAPIDGLIVLTILGVLFDDDRGVVGAFIILGEQLAGIAVGAIVGVLLAFFPPRNNVSFSFTETFGIKQKHVIKVALQCIFMGICHILLISGEEARPYNVLKFCHDLRMSLKTNATLQRTIIHILSIMCVQLLCYAWGVLSVGHLFNTAVACATVNCLSMKKWTQEVMMLKDVFEMIWHGLQPVAVIFACSMIHFQDLNAGMLWQSFLVFFLGYVIRVSLVFICSHFSGKPLKQRIFMSLCWNARGLTQGVLSTTMIAFIKTRSTPQQISDVLTIFTVNLIVGNIVGALQMWYFGPRLLPKNEPKSER